MGGNVTVNSGYGGAGVQINAGYNPNPGYPNAQIQIGVNEKKVW